MEAPEGHAHEHKCIDIAESETVLAYAEAIHEIVPLQFNQKGVALMFT